ncbi:MAG: type II secretion system GspH family protein [Cystobacterineae bacterium]|nr:type II secretion system GspH family protein [Cystobacterineae bacterium]
MHIKTPSPKLAVRRPEGFTLLEMLVVLGIVGILLALSVVAWDKMIREQEQGRFPMALRWLMEEARQKAIAENMSVRMHFEWEDKNLALAKSVSWLQLPCSREGGPLSKETCPTNPCFGESLNLSSCVPVSRSEKLPVPAGMQMPGFLYAPGICFLGGTGAFSEDCRTERREEASYPVPNFGHLPIFIEGKRPYLFFIRTMNSYIEFLNCNNIEDAKELDCFMFP